MARWFGLPTLDFALLRIVSSVDEIIFPDGSRAQSGHAFVTRAVRGTDWGGDATTIRLLDNPDDVTRLIVFDTWIRNRDRCAPETMGRQPRYSNVFLSKEGTARNRLRLLAIDHTHCFDTGELTSRIADIDKIRDPEIYGLFPGFTENLRRKKAIFERIALELRQLDRDVLRSIIGMIPAEWDVSGEARNALEEFLYRRAEFVADTIVRRLTSQLWPQQELSFPVDEEGDPK